MKTGSPSRSSPRAPSRRRGANLFGAAPARELAQLRVRLAEAEDTLRAIRRGEVDAVVVAGQAGPQVFTLQGAEHPYRLLIESMNEGALTLTANQTILYANHCFARMVQCPLKEVMGSSFRRFLPAENRAALLPLLNPAAQSGAKIQVSLLAGDGSQMRAQISVRSLAKHGSSRATIGMVVTDLTEAQRTEERLRALTHRVVQVQEAERRRVARELHDHITQLLCAIVVRCQTLVETLSSRTQPARREALELRSRVGQAAEEVERISRNLRPSVLDELGLLAVLRDTGNHFAQRTGVSFKLACAPLTARLSTDAELTLYRILQEALNNVEHHAQSHHVTVSLRQRGDWVELAITDDGVGFDPAHPKPRRKAESGLGLLSMRERAISVGGLLRVKSSPGHGATIQVRIPS